MSDKLFHVVRCGFYTIRKNDPILSVDLPDQRTFFTDCLVDVCSDELTVEVLQPLC